MIVQQSSLGPFLIAFRRSFARSKVGLSIKALLTQNNAFSLNFSTDRANAVFGRSGAGHHYSPCKNLENIDVALIDGTRHEIDMAAYVLADWPIIKTLTRAADREVKVHIYLDSW